MMTQWINTRLCLAAALLTAVAIGQAQPSKTTPPPALADGDFQAIKAYEITTKEGLVVREKLEAFVIASGQDHAALADLQKKLLAVLSAPETTVSGRDLILRAIQRMGFCDDVPAVAAFFTDAKSSGIARVALEGIADPRVDDALLAALSKAEGNAKVGIVMSLGMRRCEKAVPAILPLKDSADALLAAASLTALGRIGTATCADALLKPAAATLEAQRQGALALCLNALKGKDAVRVATTVFEDTKAPAYLRSAAVRVLILNDNGKAPAWFAKAMSDPALKLREAAARVAAVEAPGADMAEAIVSALAKAAPEDQVRLLGALAQRGEKSAATTVVGLLKSPDTLVQQAAAQTLVEIGGPEQVAALVELLAANETRDAAMSALSNIRAAGTSRKLVQVAATAEPAQRARLVTIVGARGGADAVPELSKYVTDADAAVRKETWKALREMARPEVAETYLTLLSKATDAERDSASQAVSAAMKLMPAEQRSAALVAVWNRSDATVRPTLANVMAAFPDAACAAPLIAALDDASPAVQEAAVRALADWPDAKPMDALIAKSFTLPTETLRTVALRGGVRQMALAPGADPKARLLELFRKTPDDAGRKAVSNALVERLGVDAFDALESLFADAQAGASARAAYVALYEKAKDMTASELDPDEWKAKASNGGGEVKLAFDGKKNTRWTTGAEQTPGQWFAVDLGRTAALTSVEMEYEASPTDGPKSYKVFTSMDGQSWAGPIAQGDGQDRRTLIKFANSPIARWIKIEQTGSKSGLFWSIHELHVRSGLDAVRFAAVAKKAQELKAAK